MSSASLHTMLCPFPRNRSTATSQPWELAFRAEKACTSSEVSDDPLQVLPGEFGGLQRVGGSFLLPHLRGRVFLPIQAKTQQWAAPHPSCTLLLPAPASARQGGRPAGHGPTGKRDSWRAWRESQGRGQALPSHSLSPTVSSMPLSISASTRGPRPHTRQPLGGQEVRRH